MHIRIRGIKKIGVMLAGLALVLGPVASVGATQTILVDPYDNLPVSGTTTLNVTGAGLVPGATIWIRQVATKGLTTGVALEQLTRGMPVVEADGTLQASVNVTYDIRSDGTNTVITECNNSDNTVYTRESCELRFDYYADYGSEPTFIMKQKLYFGMADPNKVIPPPAPLAPVTKDDCRDDKWSEFSTLSFKNQGACVSHVANKN